MNKDYAKTIRLSIAAKAAEIIMEEGIDDYQYAKKKAVKYLDLGSLDSLPSNDEIDNALLEYGLIFQNEIDIKNSNNDYVILRLGSVYGYSFISSKPSWLQSCNRIFC